MADYYSTNAYSRNNANSTAGTDNNNNSNNGYYSNANANTNTNTNTSTNANDIYSNNPYSQPQQSQTQNQTPQNQPFFSNFAANPNTAPASTSTSASNTTTTAATATPAAPTPSLWNPAIATKLASAAMMGSNGNNGSNEAIYKMGMEMGHTFLDQGTARLIPGLETFMKTLRVYFAVDNAYVKRKMMRVLFSFFFRNWSRRLQHNAPQQQPPSSTIAYELPINDDNAPDLYIPFMSLITYVLLCALCYGTAGQFDPEIIVDVTSKCVFIQLLEVCLFKFGIYMVTNQNTNGNTNGNGSAGANPGAGAVQTAISFLDLFAFTGYKYLALACNMLFGYSVSLIGSGKVSAYIAASSDGIDSKEASGGDSGSGSGSASLNSTEEGVGGYGQKGYYIMFLWTASSICYFMLKTMANNIQQQQQQQQQEQHGSGRKREFVILGFALSQFATLWFLGQTKFLN